MSQPRRILLADADAFYVAVARRMDPEGAGRARLLIVGGRPESRGVVCSASYEARAFGVRSAMPVSHAVRLCPGALCVPIPRDECSRLSHAIAAILGTFTPVVEAASIDEWYLDLTGTEALYHGEPLAVTARRIRDAVNAGTGLTISLGGGTNRLVAKLAVELAKPRPGTGATGVHIVEPGGEAAFLERFDLGELPGVGPRRRDRLEQAGLQSVRDVVLRDRAELARTLGGREAAWLAAVVSGRDEQPVVARERSKSLSRERTFGHDLADDAALERELLLLSARAASDLRSSGLTARTVAVKLRDADFRTRRASRTLATPVIADRVIYGAARDLLRKLRRARRVPVRLVGIALTSLERTEVRAQLALIGGGETNTETERDRTLARTVDAVRARFGRGAIGPASLTTARRSTQ